jgi:hypothetical protein
MLFASATTQGIRVGTVVSDIAKSRAEINAARLIVLNAALMARANPRPV